MNKKKTFLRKFCQFDVRVYMKYNTYAIANVSIVKKKRINNVSDSLRLGVEQGVT